MSEPQTEKPREDPPPTRQDPRPIPQEPIHDPPVFPDHDRSDEVIFDENQVAG